MLEDGYAWQKIRSVTPTGPQDVYDFTVEEDHSYIGDGLVQHNQHAVKVEIDEGQDYPLAGWIEIVECLNRGSIGAQWRIHGVSRGVRDRISNVTFPQSLQVKY